MLKLPVSVSSSRARAPFGNAILLALLPREILHRCVHELGEITVQSGDPGGERFQGSKDVTRSAQSRDLKNLILQRKEASSIQTRKDMSKKIQKQVRKEVRLWKTKWAE